VRIDAPFTARRREHRCHFLFIVLYDLTALMREDGLFHAHFPPPIELRRRGRTAETFLAVMPMRGRVVDASSSMNSLIPCRACSRSWMSITSAR